LVRVRSTLSCAAACGSQEADSFEGVRSADPLSKSSASTQWRTRSQELEAAVVAGLKLLVSIPTSIRKSQTEAARHFRESQLPGEARRVDSVFTSDEDVWHGSDYHIEAREASVATTRRSAQ
jgi:hypothetical protein